jgi:hypothetical protein
LLVGSYGVPLYIDVRRSGGFAVLVQRSEGTDPELNAGGADYYYHYDQGSGWVFVSI